jgi:hypothetical protein
MICRRLVLQSRSPCRASRQQSCDRSRRLVVEKMHRAPSRLFYSSTYGRCPVMPVRLPVPRNL